MYIHSQRFTYEIPYLYSIALTKISENFNIHVIVVLKFNMLVNEVFSIWIVGNHIFIFYISESK